ncbi:fimbria/pilus periplasmic chaperone [Salmonella enterica subsp. enterica]|nr:fimbria/pilus periplasmic chaperone [Salmonella enterica subsp. enterica]
MAVFYCASLPPQHISERYYFCSRIPISLRVDAAVKNNDALPVSKQTRFDDGDMNTARKIAARCRSAATPVYFVFNPKQAAVRVIYNNTKNAAGRESVFWF